MLQPGQQAHRHSSIYSANKGFSTHSGHLHRQHTLSIQEHQKLLPATRLPNLHEIDAYRSTRTLHYYGFKALFPLIQGSGVVCIIDSRQGCLLNSLGLHLRHLRDLASLAYALFLDSFESAGLPPSLSCAAPEHKCTASACAKSRMRL